MWLHKRRVMRMISPAMNRYSYWSRLWSRIRWVTPYDLLLLMAKVSELNAKLVALRDQLTKVSTELTTKIDTLTEQLANTEIPADAQATLDSLTASVQALDDIVPDVTPDPIDPNPSV